MTVKRKNDLDKVQVYIKRLQEIKSFLQQTQYEAGDLPENSLRVNRYWGRA